MKLAERVEATLFGDVKNREGDFESAAADVLGVKEHELKCWPPYFDDVAAGKKTFEVRKNDRNFKVGDVLLLKEFDPCRHCGGYGRVWDNGDRTDCDCIVSRNPKGIYTGATARRTVAYILDRFAGLRDDYIIMGLAE